jgi:RHS repeat-associated protein
MIKIPAGERRTVDQLKKAYEIEKELSSKLRDADKEQRKKAYTAAYDEWNARVFHDQHLSPSNGVRGYRRAVLDQMKMLKRFLRPNYSFLDSVGKAPNTNLYSFVQNNPVNFADPLGLFSINVGFEGFIGAFGFGGTGGIYGAYIHDDTQPWYKGWSAYTYVTYGGGGAGTVRGAGAGLYIGGSNASSVCDLAGPAGYGGRVAMKYFSASGYANSSDLKGGGITFGPSWGRTIGFGGGTNTKILWGGNF